METKSAIKSKTINFNAIVLAAISIMAALGVDLPDGFYQAMLAAVPILNIILRFVTKGAVSLGSQTNGQSGRASVGVLIIICALSICPLMVFMQGCAGQSATEQIKSQTNDPGTIAVAVYADAQDAYIEAQELYLPYQQTLIETNPDLNHQIVGYFRKANKILDDWAAFGEIPAEDKVLFRDYLRQITISIAKAAEQ